MSLVVGIISNEVVVAVMNVGIAPLVLLEIDWPRMPVWLFLNGQLERLPM